MLQASSPRPSSDAHVQHTQPPAQHHASVTTLKDPPIPAAHSTAPTLHPPSNPAQALLPARYKSVWQYAEQQQQERTERAARNTAAAHQRVQREKARQALEARRAPTAVVMADHQRQMVESIIKDLHAQEDSGGHAWQLPCHACCPAMPALRQASRPTALNCLQAGAL